MAIMRAGAVESAMRRLDPHIRIILFYGSDEARIRALASAAVKRVAGSIDDPFNVQRLDDSDIGSDPARLMDEVQSLSLLGGRRVIWVADADLQFHKAATRVLELASPGNLIVAESGSLGKTSPLRTLLEASSTSWIVPVYEPTAEEAQTTVKEAFRERNTAFEAGVAERLVETYGTDISLLRQEVEKLSVYGMESEFVGLSDVEAVCTSGGELDLNDVIDAALSGQTAEVEGLLVRYVAGGGDPGQVAGACMRHVVQLQELLMMIERGQQPQAALKSVRPAIFFKRSENVLAQLRVWSLQELLGAAAALSAAVRDERTVQGLDGAIGMRALLSVSRRAQGLMRDRV